MAEPKITPGNKKLGNSIYAWSITPGHGASCPGETKTCGSLCYAKSGLFMMPSPQALHAVNFKKSKEQGFAKWMNAQLIAFRAKVLRIHVAGDFYSDVYLDKWLQIVQRNSRVKFFAYTRSWQPDAFIDENRLLALAALPNMQLWYSADRDTGRPPIRPNVRVAYMAIDAQDFPGYRPDLLFRVIRHTVKKKVLGVQVCPAENGVKLENKITCERCQICTIEPKKLVSLGTLTTPKPVQVVGRLVQPRGGARLERR